MKKKGLSILLASAMVAAMLTGCGNDGGQSSGSSEASDSGSAADSGAAESEASDSGEEASDAGAADSGEVPTITYAHTGKASADMEIWPPDFVKQMEEDLGVKIEVIQITDEQFDLAVASGDATSQVYTPDELVRNVINDVVRYDTSVVLMHDSSAKSTTVEALIPMIDQLQEMGAELLPIDETTEPIQHITAENVE